MMSDDKIELVARFFWERTGPATWTDALPEVKAQAIATVRGMALHRLVAYYDAIEFGRKLGAEQRLIPMYAPGEHNGPIESAEELFK